MRKSRVKSFLNCKYILCYFSVQGQDYILFFFFLWNMNNLWILNYMIQITLFLIKFHSILFRTRIKNFQVKLRSQVLIVNIIFSGANYLKWERKKKRKKHDLKHWCVFQSIYLGVLAFHLFHYPQSSKTR
jgi:hypothetical protein